MAILVLDTALHCAQAALFEDERWLAQGLRTGDREQAEILLPLLNDILKEAKLDWKDLSQVVVTVGPGVFTGIRTGIAVARALRLALGIPVIGVSTLHVLAAQAEDNSKAVLSLIDAHKDEVYAQLFSSNLKPQLQPLLLKVSKLASYIDNAEQIVVYPSGFAKNLNRQKNVQAVDQLNLAQALKCAALLPHPPLPLYVRVPDALPQAGAMLRRA
jgi:tRNA threonylcarbamoyladenosine biosynthesis protein TsaB